MYIYIYIDCIRYMYIWYIYIYNFKTFSIFETTQFTWARPVVPWSPRTQLHLRISRRVERSGHRGPLRRRSRSCLSQMPLGKMRRFPWDLVFYCGVLGDIYIYMYRYVYTYTWYMRGFCWFWFEMKTLKMGICYWGLLIVDLLEVVCWFIV